MRAASLPNRAAEVRSRLIDANLVCGLLGLEHGASKQARGLLIRCPWHADRTPSCSVRQAPDGTISVKCFGCDRTGDVLDLIAAAHGLNARHDFPEVLRLAVELAGAPGDQTTARLPARARPLTAQPGYPPAAEVASVWDACGSVLEDGEVSAWLRSRELDAGQVDLFGLARALPLGADGPSWARFQGRTWAEAGYRCLFPLFDEDGTLRSLRARRVLGGDGPKALPPAGHRAGGLVMADALGRMLLATGKAPDLWPAREPLRIVVSEGEPDYLTWGTAFADSDATAPAVIGVVAGAWTPDIAARVPDGARLIVRTHHDDAGEKYARAIFGTFAGRRVALIRGGAKGCPGCVAWLRGVA